MRAIPVLESPKSIRESMLLLWPCLIFTAGCAQARPQLAQASQAQACQPAQAEAADAMVDKLDDWPAVDRFFKAYRQCDDGYIAEGSSDAIAQLLARQWDTLPNLQALIRQEPALRSFVLCQINTTLDSDELDRIKRNATESCPSDGASLCADLRLTAEHASK